MSLLNSDPLSSLLSALVFSSRSESSSCEGHFNSKDHFDSEGQLDTIKNCTFFAVICKCAPC